MSRSLPVSAIFWLFLVQVFNIWLSTYHFFNVLHHALVEDCHGSCSCHGSFGMPGGRASKYHPISPPFAPAACFAVLAAVVARQGIASSDASDTFLKCRNNTARKARLSAAQTAKKRHSCTVCLLININLKEGVANLGQQVPRRQLLLSTYRESSATIWNPGS